MKVDFSNECDMSVHSTTPKAIRRMSDTGCQRGIQKASEFPDCCCCIHFIRGSAVQRDAFFKRSSKTMDESNELSDPVYHLLRCAATPDHQPSTCKCVCHMDDFEGHRGLAEMSSPINVLFSPRSRPQTQLPYKTKLAESKSPHSLPTLYSDEGLTPGTEDYPMSRGENISPHSTGTNERPESLARFDNLAAAASEGFQKLIRINLPMKFTPKKEGSSSVYSSELLRSLHYSELSWVAGVTFFHFRYQLCEFRYTSNCCQTRFFVYVIWCRDFPHRFCDCASKSHRDCTGDVQLDINDSANQKAVLKRQEASQLVCVLRNYDTFMKWQSNWPVEHHRNSFILLFSFVSDHERTRRNKSTPGIAYMGTNLRKKLQGSKTKYGLFQCMCFRCVYNQLKKSDHSKNIRPSHFSLFVEFKPLRFASENRQCSYKRKNKPLDHSLYHSVSSPYDLNSDGGFVTTASAENQHVVSMEVCRIHKLNTTPEATRLRFFKQVSGKYYDINYISKQHWIKATTAAVSGKLY
ncbi:hypothetical protein CLF_103364 [Clonorchis sinensis]|uniref:Uncharacterized protein n=1 Tax=Clonorchis sinensis TaxID=79923 RepID=G7Y9M4_CLOSI|nr:hypothetical protein CLF_103364 [Clonorchis sinensis]